MWACWRLQQGANWYCCLLFISCLLIIFNNFLNLLDVIIHLRIALNVQNGFVVRAFLPPLNDLLFGIEKFAFDKPLIVFFDRFLDYTHNCLILLQNFIYPVLFSN